jgi:molybdopterin converting factor small subunit
MKIAVQLFARARDLAGCGVVNLDLPDGSTVGDVRKRLAGVCPALSGLIERSALAVNNDFADDSLTLPHEAEVALLPPVSGG